MSQCPNILLITSDQQHYDTLGVTNPRIKTPALDRLAHEGTNFTRAYCPNPVCSPSRASIITGMYPSWHHCWTIGVKLPEDVPTVGDALQANGYDTSLIGKAHFQPLATRPGSESIECQPILRDLEFWRNFHGPWYGFRHIETARMHGDEPHAGGHYAIWMEENGLGNWRDYFMHYPPRDDDPRREFSWELPEEHHYSRWTAEKTIEYVRIHARERHPFFCWASFHDPHPPYLVPQPWDKMYDPNDMVVGKYTEGEFDAMPPHFAQTRQKRPDFSMFEESGFANHGFMCHVAGDEWMRKNIAVYYGMISFMDQQIGRILDELDRLGMAKNTIVVFTTDHGHFLGQHGLIAKGAFHYEDMLRVPFLVRWPGHVPAGATSSSLQSLVDLSPTFLAAAGIEIPGIMQGVSQLDTWCGRRESSRDHVIVENRHQPTKLDLRSFVTDRYKLTLYRDHDWGELFDLQEDPGELRNRFDDPDYAAVKVQLMHHFLNAEMQREPTRMPRIAGA